VTGATGKTGSVVVAARLNAAYQSPITGVIRELNWPGFLAALPVVAKKHSLFVSLLNVNCAFQTGSFSRQP